MIRARGQETCGRNRLAFFGRIVEPHDGALA
jgi:hypothetical protein